MTSFEACLGRLSFQLEKATKYFSFTYKTILSSKDEDITKLFHEFFVIKIFSIYDEYIKSIIFLGGISKENEMIQYFNSLEKDKTFQINDLKGLISKLRTIRFYESRCKKLKTIFKKMFSFDFFPDLKTENLFLDLILLRNVIIHNGGSIEGKQVKQLHYTDVVEKTSNLSEPFNFYSLKIFKSKFNIEIIKALKNLSIHIHSKLKQ